MSRTTLGLPWLASCAVRHPSWTLFSAFSINKMSSLHLHSRKLHDSATHYAQFHPAGQTMGSITAAREHHRNQFLFNISALTCTQALIPTSIQAADGFAATSWNVIHATLHLTLTCSARGLSNYVLELFQSRITIRKKGASTGFLFSRPTTENVS